MEATRERALVGHSAGDCEQGSEEQRRREHQEYTHQRTVARCFHLRHLYSFRIHSQVVYLVIRARIGDAVEELPDARLRALLDLLYRPDRQNSTAIDQDNAIGNEER